MTTSLELPACKHRGEFISDSKVQCACKSIESPSGVVPTAACKGKPWQLPACPYSDAGEASLPPEKPLPTRREAPTPVSRGLGDTIESALAVVGITSDRIEEWLGRPCGCKKRKEKFNRLGNWVKRVLSGKTDQAEEYLNEMIGEDSE